jgi:DHA3 family macrolide efflux protein-like MFS transporter
MNPKNRMQSYLVFWLSQSASQLGSSMTGFALMIWTYQQTDSAMAVSLLTFFSYLPYIIVSILAGAFVDTHQKKSIMLWTDSIAAICSVFVIVRLFSDGLQIWQIYLANLVTGLMNAFQNPAATVAVGLLVPKEKYIKVSGLNSFSNSVITVATPMLAAFTSSFWGLGGVLCIDLATFCCALLVLLLLIQIPEKHLKGRGLKRNNILRGCEEGFAFLVKHKGLLYVIFSMALLNFFSRLTYENILPAMILARSGGNNNVLGIVSGILGCGGIAGGLIVSTLKTPKSSAKMMYLSAGFSFLFGDLLMGIGQNVFMWFLAALAASVPIPFIIAGQNVLMYDTVPQEMFYHSNRDFIRRRTG